MVTSLLRFLGRVKLPPCASTNFATWLFWEFHTYDLREVTHNPPRSQDRTRTCKYESINYLDLLPIIEWTHALTQFRHLTNGVRYPFFISLGPTWAFTGCSQDRIRTCITSLFLTGNRTAIVLSIPPPDYIYFVLLSKSINNSFLTSNSIILLA